MLRLRSFLMLAALATLLYTVLPSHAQNPPAPDPVTVGLVGTLFQEVPLPLVNAMMKPFNDLMKELTGLNGKALPCGGAFDVGKKLEDKTLHLGVFQGFEFAWAKQKYPNLKPLMIAVYYNRNLQVHLVTSATSDATDFASLKGKDFGLPAGSKGHSKLFLERQITANGGSDAKAYFSQLTRPANLEEALDDVCGGTVQGTVVDSVSYENYQRLKPGCFKRLKILKSSEIFPPAVIAYRDGVFAPADLEKFKAGMFNAHSTAWGKQLMQIFKITAFENVPDNYAQTCANILRVYPPPPEVAPAPAPKATSAR